jgi:deoxyribodipyrimidine photo-lyase
MSSGTGNKTVKSSIKPYGIHWFRRDLRLQGNLNLQENFEKLEGRVLGLFCIDSSILNRSDISFNRFAFLLKTLAVLQKEMRILGGDLLVVDQKPQDFFTALQKLKQVPSVVSFGRDYEPFAVKRDLKITKIIEKSGSDIICGRDHLIFEPGEILKDDGGYYQVFTPYAKKWFQKLHNFESQERLKAQSNEFFKKGTAFKIKWSELGFNFHDALDKVQKLNEKNVTVQLPQAGHEAARKVLKDFKSKIKVYNSDRDFPSLNGTSHLSVYLKNGSISPAQIVHELNLTRVQLTAGGPPTFLKEIVWREFYYSILFHRPDVESGPFLTQYKNLKWSDNQQWFKKWCEGNTGFPIVDAGMRQLNQTGWMHNRVRMIVASFLVKDLLINWQWGENYFMKTLLDGDLAANNGGWQWAASTGCDPQPYFRIFNPWMQAAKFDPDAGYIKKYIPELSKLSAKEIHSPDGRMSVKKYPRPLVDHKFQSAQAIQLYRQIKK